MATYALYLRNDGENTFKSLGVINHAEVEALANSAGQKRSFSKTKSLQVFCRIRNVLYARAGLTESRTKNHNRLYPCVSNRQPRAMR